MNDDKVEASPDKSLKKSEPSLLESKKKEEKEFTEKVENNSNKKVE